MKKTLLLFLGFLWLSCAPAFGASANLSLGKALELTLLHNNTIRESFEQIAAAKGGVQASKGAYDLQLYGSIKYGAWNKLEESDYPFPTNSATAHRAAEAGFRQRIPTGTMLSVYYTDLETNKFGALNQPSLQTVQYLTFELAQSLLKEVGDKSVKGAIEKAMLQVKDSEENRQLVITQALSEVARDYWVLWLAYRNLEIAQEVYDMSEELLRREKVRFSEGLAQGVDVDRAIAAKEQRLASLVAYKRDVAVLEERIIFGMNAMQETRCMGLTLTSSPDKEMMTLPDVESAVQMAFMKRPEMAQMSYLLKQLDIDLGINKNSLLPTVDLVLQYRTFSGVDFIKSAEDFKNTDQKGSWYVGLQAAYPLQNREAKGNLEQTKRLINVAQQRVENTTNSIEREVRDSVQNIILAQTQIPATYNAYQASQKTLEGEKVRFENFQANNRDILAAQEVLAQNKMMYYKSIVDYNISFLSYLVTTGTFLEHYGVLLDEYHAYIQ